MTACNLSEESESEQMVLKTIYHIIYQIFKIIMSSFCFVHYLKYALCLVRKNSDLIYS